MHQNETVDTLGARLRYARTEAGLTQQALGTLAGVTGPYVSMLEGGHRANPRALELEAIAKALGVTTGWLLHGEPEPDVALIRKAGAAAKAAAS